MGTFRNQAVSTQGKLSFLKIFILMLGLMKDGQMGGNVTGQKAYDLMVTR